MEIEKRIVLFDGLCNLCNGLVCWIIKIDKSAIFRFASLQSPAGQGLLEQHHLPISEFSTFVLIDGDQYYLKSTAVLKLFRIIGGGWRLLYPLMIVPRPLRDWIYDLVARSRSSLFGRNEHCLLPTVELKSRFIE